MGAAAAMAWAAAAAVGEGGELSGEGVEYVLPALPQNALY